MNLLLVRDQEVAAFSPAPIPNLARLKFLENDRPAALVVG